MAESLNSNFCLVVAANTQLTHPERHESDSDDKNEKGRTGRGEKGRHVLLGFPPQLKGRAVPEPCRGSFSGSVKETKAGDRTVLLASACEKSEVGAPARMKGRDGMWGESGWLYGGAA